MALITHVAKSDTRFIPTNDVQRLVLDSQFRMYVLIAEIFLYGTYVILFGFYLDILRRRGFSKHRWLHSATISLFVLCTAHCIFLFASTVLNNNLDLSVTISSSLPPGTIDIASSSSLATVPGSITFAALNSTTNIVYVTSNIIADIIFIFRCYAIWNFRRRVIVFPTICTMGTAFMGYLNAAGLVTPGGHLATAFILSVMISLTTTVILVGLSAGRIWWLARTARFTLGAKVASQYYTTCAMILESGALYCAGGIAFLVLATSIRTGTTERLVSDLISGAVLGQLVGIAPTIIAVRVGLGQSVEGVGSFATTGQRRT
ncbi:hypothetical protein B0H19DRAFT_1268745 [Mycena capillaripes]|nr:hypothetical protein B0H19DRAFT_1268745 [Mycena capillaripes]